ncbi:zinc transporter 2 [Bradysia coprophila]|uniref:zinc transporter 2 n=1 Tax=Bradysia coprophila TaxID=38358 RepID=UPI00187DC59B|nr:zinc transporter 2 [Bradysia coprophila]
MADYIDNSVGNDDGSSYIQYSGNEDQDIPLIKDYIIETSQPPCKYNNNGDTNASTDIQSKKAKRQLMMATSLCFVFMIAELIGGYFAGSLAIMADAAHLLTDCISFIVAIIAIWWAKKPADDRMSFGYKRLEVAGAVVSILGIWSLTAILFYLAIDRLVSNDYDINADTMMIVSAIGIAMNIVMAFVLHGSCHGHHSHSLSHAHSHSHSHSPKPIRKHKYSTLSDDAYQSNDDELIRNNNSAQNINGSNVLLSRSDSFCSYRSPNHSRTNSFSKKITSLDGRKQSIPSASPSAMLQIKLTETMNHRNSFDGAADRNFNQHKHRHGQDDGKTGCETSEEQTSEFSKKNINIQAAVIHVLGDFIQSIGVFVAALVIKIYPGAKIADPICTFVFSIIVIFTTVRIMKESLAVLLDAVPKSIKLSDLNEQLSRIDGVCSVHFLNVWSVTTNHHLMSAHILIDAHASSEYVLYTATRLARKKFDIKSSTLQIERQAYDTNNILEPEFCVT